MYDIIDLRNNENALREKHLYKLAEEILLHSAVYNQHPVGEFMKRYGAKFNALGMHDLKAKHFYCAEWKIKKLLKNNFNI